MRVSLGITALLWIWVAMSCGGSKAEKKPDPKPVETAKEEPPPPDAGPPAPVIPDPCDLFGQNCPDGMACAITQGKAACGTVGTVPVAQPCASTVDCIKGLVCSPNGCRAPCDDAHKCAEPDVCTPLEVATGFSACAPPPPPAAVAAPANESKKGKGKKGKK